MLRELPSDFLSEKKKKLLRKAMLNLAIYVGYGVLVSAGVLAI